MSRLHAASREAKIEAAIPLHPSELNERIVRKVFRRRGRLHAYESIDPERTALVVIDLVKASVDNNPDCLAIVPRVNALAKTLRAAGGKVCWVVPAPVRSLSEDAIAVFGAERARYFVDVSQVSDERSTLHAELDVRESDLQFEKSGASAFFPGKCALPDRLAKAEINNILIAGTVTNVCCESSARDAVELGYRVTMISDANAGHSHGLHEATLNTFYRVFGDVRTTDEILDLIGQAT